MRNLYWIAFWVLWVVGCASGTGHEQAAGSVNGAGGASAASATSGGGDGGGADAGGEGGARACFTPCGYPVGDAIDCAALGQPPDGGCAPVMSDGLPCWRGVGTCSTGACAAPTGQCDQGPPTGAWAVCMDDVDCDDGNPCTGGDCPEPGCLPCHQVPVTDGTPCGAGKVCRKGACCAL